MSTYLETTQELYKEAALAPQASLCCASSTPYALPGLVVPEEMTAMKGEGELEAQYCNKCEEEKHMEDIRDETNWNLDTEGGEG